VIRGNRDVTPQEKMILCYLKDMIDCGHSFQRPMLYSMAMVPHKYERKLPYYHLDLIFSMLDASTKGLRNECWRVQDLDIFNGTSVLIGKQELLGSTITITFTIILRMQHDFPCLFRPKSGLNFCDSTACLNTTMQ
jgi:hypothetical protein